MRILIVDDDQSGRALLTEYLKSYGVSEFAENGLEAIEVFEAGLDRGEPFDLVCLDISMPIMDGHTTLKEIRRIESERGVATGCKVVMITAIRSVRTVMETFGDMCDAYLPKPLDKRRFFDQLESLGLVSN